MSGAAARTGELKKKEDMELQEKSQVGDSGQLKTEKEE